MNNADLLTAALRQTAAGKAGAKGGMNGSANTKDGKEKAEHFREQLRLVSKEPKAIKPHVVKAGEDAKPVDAKPVLDAASVLAELTVEPSQQPNVHDNQSDDDDTPKAAGGDDVPAKSAHWRGPDAALSAVMAKFDRGHSPTAAAGEVPRVSAPEANTEDVPLDSTKLTDAVKADVPDADATDAKRFTLTVETTDTKPLPATKAVVREQETHFEPVQQVTTLQKIVDRMASDLPSVVSPEAPHATDASGLDANKATDSRPVRMMTLELDPPNLGSVTVKMRLAGDSVEIHLTASRHETTEMLRQERGALTDAMQSAGYTFDIAAIDHTRTPDSNLNNGQQQQQQAAPDQRSSPSSSGGSQADGGSSGRSSSDSQSSARQNRQDHEQSLRPGERQQDQNGSRVRSSTVYI